MTLWNRLSPAIPGLLFALVLLAGYALVSVVEASDMPALLTRWLEGMLS